MGSFDDIQKNNRADSAESANQVFYRPGEEPQEVRQQLEELFKKLDSAYPDKVVSGLYTDHKKWGELVTVLYRKLGYPDGKSFLEAYGYTVNRAAAKKPGGDSKTIVLEELKKRYPNGSGFYKVQELKDANPDLASRFSNLANRANEFFGMSLAKYLVQEGILAEKTNDKYGESGSDEIEKLRARYAEKPFTGTLKELYAANPDIDWNAVKRYQSQSGNKNAFKAFLIREGIISEEIPSTSRFRTRTPQVFHVSAQDNPVQQAPSAEEKPAVQSGQSILPQKGQAAVQQMQSQSHAEKTEPTVQEPAAEMPHYEPPVYYVEKIEMSGEEANNWQYMRNYSCREDEIIVVDYLGNEDSITIPVSINGKKVINSSGLRNCTASTVKIPGTIKNLSNNLGFGNKNIKTLIIGEGVETIGRGCF